MTSRDSVNEILNKSRKLRDESYYKKLQPPRIHQHGPILEATTLSKEF